MGQYNEMQFAIVDPVNSSNNTARNSQQTAQILERFHDVHKNLKLLSQQPLENKSSGTQKQVDGSLESPGETEEVASKKVEQAAEDEKEETVQGSELTDSALEQTDVCPVAQTKAQE